MKKPQTILLSLTTLLVIAHVFAIVALVGLILFSSIVDEMGKGDIGVIITGFTFATLIVNAILLFQARQKIKAQNFTRGRHLLFTAGGIFLAYNLAATLLNIAFLQNLLISTLVLAAVLVAASRLGKPKQA